MQDLRARFLFHLILFLLGTVMKVNEILQNICLISGAFEFQVSVKLIANADFAEGL